MVRDFIAKVRDRAIGVEVLQSVSPGQQVIKIVNDVMIEALGGAGAVPINLNAAAPVPILLVGLQGSGKTTTAGKLALRFRERLRKKILLASLDTQRPAAQLQLAATGRAGRRPQPAHHRRPDAGADRPARHGYRPARGLRHRAARHRRPPLDRRSADGRGDGIRAATNPAETLLVVDAMTGQDAVNTAKAFNDAVGITGIVLTRMDGDARGGAALSMRAITGAPIKLVGVGEKQDALEDFHPERVAGRILGMGDIVGAGRKSLRNDRPGGSRKTRREDDARQVRPGGFRAAAEADSEDGQPVGHPRHVARHRQDQAAAGRAPISTTSPEASGGDHLVDDDEGTARRRTSSRRAASGASPPAPAPRCRKSTSC